MDIAAAAAITAADRIATRRHEHDPDLQLPDGPAGLVRHVCRHRRVPQTMLRADLRDALAVLDFLELDLAQLRLWVLRELREAAGLSYRDLARLLRMRHRSGAEALVRRLEAAVEGGRRDEHPGRETRRAERAAARAARAVAAEQAAQLRAVVATLRAHRHELDEDTAGDVDYLAEAHARGDAAAVLSWLREILPDLRDRPLCKELRTAVDRGAQLLERSRT